MSGRFPPRIFRRVPFEAELRLRFEDGEEITARSANVSLGGMYVVAAEPRPVGSIFELSFKLPEQPAPVRGRGRVVWVRPESEGAGQPAGMGLRFLELTPGSRELIFEVVERRVRAGGSPYDDGEDTATIADRRGGPGAAAGVGPAIGAAAPVLSAAEPPPWPPAVAPAPVRPSGRPLAGLDLEASGSRPAPSAPLPADEESAGEAGFGEPAAAPAVAGLWDRPVTAPVEEEPEPPVPPPARPTLPPVEMPDLPRARWEDPGRGGYPGVSGGYAARARRRSGAGWWLAGAAAIALMAAGAWWLLRGEEASVAADRPPAAAPAEDEPAGGAGEPGGPGGPAGESAAVAEPDGPSAAPEPRGSAGAAGASGPPADPPAAAGAAPGHATAPSPPAAAPPVVTPAPPSGRASRITHITWRQEDGATELVIWGDGRFDPGAVRATTLGGERPRALIRLIGIAAPFDGGSVEVDTTQVQRVRTGLHLETEPDELHVVVDLVSDRVTASEVQEDGERLRLRLEGP